VGIGQWKALAIILSNWIPTILFCVQRCWNYDIAKCNLRTHFVFESTSDIAGFSFVNLNIPVFIPGFNTREMRLELVRCSGWI